VPILTRTDTQQQYRLARGVTTVGRRETNSIVVDDKQVSRGHCRIEGQKRTWTLYDSNSASGTFVNGRRVYEHRLSPGDRIQIGSAVFLFEIPRFAPPVPSAHRLSDAAARRLVPDRDSPSTAHRWLARLRRWLRRRPRGRP